MLHETNRAAHSAFVFAIGALAVAFGVRRGGRRRGMACHGQEHKEQWKTENGHQQHQGRLLHGLGKNKHKLKLRVVKGKQTLTYDLSSNATYEVFPLQLGSGKYEITLYENVSGKKYSQEGKVSLNVKLRREDAAFLCPSQYLNYSQVSAAVERADELCAGKSEKEAYALVCNFMKSGFVYDFVKAATVKPGMLPDIDGSYQKKMGVCQDLSAIMICMLRTQGIPSRLIIGYADKQYHAWVVTDVKGEECFFDPTAALSAISKVKQYTMERFY